MEEYLKPEILHEHFTSLRLSIFVLFFCLEICSLNIYSTSATNLSSKASLGRKLHFGFHTPSDVSPNYSFARLPLWLVEVAFWDRIPRIFAHHSTPLERNFRLPQLLHTRSIHSPHSNMPPKSSNPKTPAKTPAKPKVSKQVLPAMDSPHENPTYSSRGSAYPTHPPHSNISPTRSALPKTTFAQQYQAPPFQQYGSPSRDSKQRYGNDKATPSIPSYHPLDEAQRQLEAQILREIDEQDHDDTPPSYEESFHHHAPPSLQRYDDNRQATSAYIFSFGKYKGRAIEEVAKEAPGYIDWCIRDNVGMERPDAQALWQALREYQ